MRNFYLLLLFFALASCHDYGRRLAPVEELKWRSYLGRPMTHIVCPGETIYSIAFRYDLDFREILIYNKLHRSLLHVGQRLQLPYPNLNKIPNQPIKANPFQLKKINAHPIKSPVTNYKPRLPVNSNVFWVWPAEGKIINNFNPNLGKKGIDIAGKKGGAIHAASAGVVAYSGNGLAGYGNLIIIKHHGQFLTAYGNNLHNRVVEGQFVKAGQIIADMGIVERKFWGVHFEVRKAGQPVNPKGYLPQRR